MRWQLTLLAVGGIALVVAVFAVLMSMSAGFEAALRSTGRPDNAIVVQRGSGSELTSGVPLADRNMIVVDDRVARDASGQPLASWELVVVVGLPRASDGQPANVTLRAVTPRAFEVRGGIRVVEGRAFTPGLDEVIVGRKLTTRIKGLELGGNVKYQQKLFKIVGLFESTGEAFESEIWGDYDTFARDLPARRGQQLAGRAHEGPRRDPRARPLDPRAAADAAAGGRREEVLRGAGGAARPRSSAASPPSSPSSWASAPSSGPSTRCTRSSRPAPARSARCARSASRAARSSSSFLIESVILAVIGGAIGCVLAFPMNGFSTGTGQTQSFSEIAFAFRITPQIVATSAWSSPSLMGVLGGLLPALRGARLPITSALRSA